MVEPILQIRDLHAKVEGKEILKGVDLSVNRGEVHAVMGPNGSGKSTLSNIVMGHPKYEVTKGEILFNGKNVLGLDATERAKMGLFLSFQYPLEIAGVGFRRFMHAAYRARHPDKNVGAVEFNSVVKEKAALLGIQDEMIKRELNVGFSGGEKKRAEILQLMVLQPSLAILDETDSGLDIDSLKLVAEAVNRLRSRDFSALVITHYKRILNHLKPDRVHVLVDGKIVAGGDADFADKLEENGYGWIAADKVAAEQAEKTVEVTS